MKVGQREGGENDLRRLLTCTTTYTHTQYMYIHPTDNSPTTALHRVEHYMYM